MINFFKKADIIGVLTSTLCLIHCFLAPFVFMAWTTSSAHKNTTQSWWYLLDYLFIVVSFLAIFKTTQNTNNRWINLGFWFSWLFLIVLLLNEKISYIAAPETLIYIPTLSIIILHIYNLNKAPLDTVALNSATTKF